MLEPTHSKNMRKSNWIISPGRGKNKKYLSCHLLAIQFELFLAWKEIMEMESGYEEDMDLWGPNNALMEPMSMNPRSI